MARRGRSGAEPSRWLHPWLLTAAAAGVGLVLWHSPVLYPLKLLSVTLHEAGHALAAYLVGGHVLRISIDRYEGGLTHSVFPPGVWREGLVASAGYLGNALLGALLLRLARRPERAPWVLALLGGGLLALAVLFFRDAFSWLFAAPTAAVFLAAARYAPRVLAHATALFVSAFTCLYALFDLRSDVLWFPWEAGPGGRTDADVLSSLFLLPAFAWGLLWAVLAALSMAWSLGIPGAHRRRG